MIRTCLLFSVLMVLEPACSAGSPHLVKVVTGGYKEGQAVAAALSARLNGTDRYRTVENDTAEFTVEILCMDLEQYKVTGSICSFVVTYFHFTSLRAPALSAVLETNLLSANSRERLGEMIFENFVAATTEEKIKEGSTRIKLNVVSFCAAPENFQTCLRNIGKGTVGR